LSVTSSSTLTSTTPTHTTTTISTTTTSTTVPRHLWSAEIAVTEAFDFVDKYEDKPAHVSVAFDFSSNIPVRLSAFVATSAEVASTHFVADGESASPPNSADNVAGGSYTCTTGAAIPGDSDVPLFNGEYTGIGLTEAECAAECDASAACASYVFAAWGGSCKLWARSCGAGELQGSSHCTKHKDTCVDSLACSVLGPNATGNGTCDEALFKSLCPVACGQCVPATATSTTPTTTTQTHFECVDAPTCANFAGFLTETSCTIGKFGALCPVA
jgi:hypothetical protein